MSSSLCCALYSPGPEFSMAELPVLQAAGLQEAAPFFSTAQGAAVSLSRPRAPLSSAALACTSSLLTSVPAASPLLAVPQDVRGVFDKLLPPPACPPKPARRGRRKRRDLHSRPPRPPRTPRTALPPAIQPAPRHPARKPQFPRGRRSRRDPARRNPATAAANYPPTSRNSATTAAAAVTSANCPLQSRHGRRERREIPARKPQSRPLQPHQPP
eukprot:XP_020398596.1 BUD13 homolog [Zea mays]